MNNAAKAFINDLIADGYELKTLEYKDNRVTFHFELQEGLFEPYKKRLLDLLNNGQIMCVELNEKELVTMFFHKADNPMLDKPMPPFPPSTYTTGII